MPDPDMPDPDMPDPDMPDPDMPGPDMPGPDMPDPDMPDPDMPDTQEMGNRSRSSSPQVGELNSTACKQRRSQKKASLLHSIRAGRNWDARG